MSTEDAPQIIHVEIVHPDPEAAAQFMRDTLGARDVEPRTQALIKQMFPGIGLAHVMVGQVVFQFVKPTDALPSWAKQLEQRGPSIHNVTISVPDIDTVTDAMLERGGKMLFDVPEVDFSAAGYEHPPGMRGNAIDAREQTGIVFEMIPTALGWIPGEAP
jgi:catechol 2,3-dioxygenase-like lactoylglutathione lyase family enzyme